MSRSLLYLFGDFIKELKPEFGIKLATAIVVSDIGYTYGTTTKKQIVVESKYKFDRRGFTDFMVVDKEGNHYSVNNSLWFMKWDAIEDWHSIEKNKPLDVKYFGLRVPFLGAFPNIVRINKVSNSYSVVANGEWKSVEDSKFV
jgi:hypothetical protein